MSVGAGQGHAAGQELRRPFLIAAIVVALLIVMIEVGARFAVRPNLPDDPVAAAGATPEGSRALEEADDPDALREQLQRLNEGSRPPGLAIPDLALLDGLLLLTMVLTALALLREQLVGRVQGIVMLIASILVLIGAVVAAISAFAKLMFMLGLFLAAPFGTIAYLVLFGFFDRPAAVTALGLILFLKLAFCVLLFLAQQRFAQNKGLVIFLILSLVLTLVVGFLHSFVPLPLVSITDALAGLIVSIVAAIWAAVTLVFAVFAIVQAVR